METTDYTHLSDSSIDDILRSIGITVQENSTATTSTVTAREGNSRRDNEVETQPTPSSEGILAQIEEEPHYYTHIDAEEIIRDFIGATSEEDTDTSSSAKPSTTLNGPAIITKREYYDNAYMSRFVGAPWAEAATKQQVLIAGMGGIGSWASLLIARLGVEKLILVDYDIIEKHNLSGQFYSKRQVGQPKIVGLAESISLFADNPGVETRFVEIDRSFPLEVIPKITVCGFDNMKARKTMFNLWKTKINTLSKEEKADYLFIDGRLSLDTLQLFIFTGADKYYMDRYEKEFLFSDAEADATQCSAKQTSFMANMIGGFIANVIVSFCFDNLPTGLPFFIEYDSNLYNLKVER